jgi:hypothetical protein
MPEVEMWTSNAVGPSKAPIQRVGINFGAPGDRRAENGTLWLEYPSVGGDSPPLDVVLTPEKPSWFRLHSSRLRGGNLKWVETSGAIGLRSVRIGLSGARAEKSRDSNAADAGQERVGVSRPYTVHLHFMEPEDKKPGERRFDVALNGQTVLKGFDIVAEARDVRVGIVKTFQGIRASDALTILLTPSDAKSEPLLCGIELIAEP